MDRKAHLLPVLLAPRSPPHSKARSEGTTGRLPQNSTSPVWVRRICKARSIECMSVCAAQELIAALSRTLNLLKTCRGAACTVKSFGVNIWE